MEINPEFKIGAEVFIKIDSRRGIVIAYTFDDERLYYNIRYIVNDTYNTGIFHSTELSREYNG